MGSRKSDDCHLLYTVCLTEESTEAVELLQAYVKKQEKKSSFNKSQAINRIIREWKDDRKLTLEVEKRNQK